MARVRRRRLELVPWALDNTDAPCGLLVSTEDADYIVYADGPVALLRQHNILHELSHLLLGHDGVNLNPVNAQEVEAEILASLIAAG